MLPESQLSVAPVALPIAPPFGAIEPEGVPAEIQSFPIPRRHPRAIDSRKHGNELGKPLEYHGTLVIVDARL